jgi:hypothetical protein
MRYQQIQQSIEEMYTCQQSWWAFPLSPSSVCSTAYGSIVYISLYCTYSPSQPPSSSSSSSLQKLDLSTASAMLLFCFMDIQCYFTTKRWTSSSLLINIDSQDMYDASNCYVQCKHVQSCVGSALLFIIYQGSWCQLSSHMIRSTVQHIDSMYLMV